MDGLSRNKGPDIVEPGYFPRFYEAIRAVHAHGIVVIDPQGRITTVTPESGRLLGLNQPVSTETRADALPGPVRDAISRVNASGKPELDSCLRITAGDAPSAMLKVSVFPLPCDGGRGAIVVVDDLDAARKLEHHLQRLDRLADIGTLSASMAHEIKNALVAGKAFVDVLLEKHAEVEFASVVRREMSRVDAIVSRMLNYAGNYERKFQLLHVHEMLEHSLRLVKPQMNSKGIVLDKALLATADLVNGNENELQQAVMNLLLNALEAMAPGGRLTISTESPGQGGSEVLREGSEAGRIQILIADTGPGIEPDKLARVFTPFFTTKPEGTGLGLAITQRIVQEHAGSISVESELNRGTRFCVALPLVDSCAADQ